MFSRVNRVCRFYFTILLFNRPIANLFRSPSSVRAFSPLRSPPRFLLTIFVEISPISQLLRACLRRKQEPKCKIAQGLCDDLRRRISHYISDYVDGVVGHQTLHKTISTIFFLYFACLLPTIAFGVLNDNNTQGKIGKCGRGA